METLGHNRPPDELPPHSPEFEALSRMGDAFLKYVGRDGAVQFLHILATAVEQEDETVVSLRDGPQGARSRRQANAWLRRNVTLWLARHG